MSLPRIFFIVRAKNANFTEKGRLVNELQGKVGGFKRFPLIRKTEETTRRMQFMVMTAHVVLPRSVSTDEPTEARSV